MRILITAGPTVEFLDPVRFLSNRSSGKMGYCLATQALRLGHKVVLVSGPTALPKPVGCEFVAVQTAKEMLQTLQVHFPKCDVLMMAAAVADYRPQTVSKQKIKKTQTTLTLKLRRNPDLLKMMAAQKLKHQMLVGFAAETNQLLANAQKKLRVKKLDWIVLNDVSRSDIGFEGDNNEVVLISAQKVCHKIPKQSKKSVAQKILAIVLPDVRSK